MGRQPSIEEGRHLGQHLVHDRFRQALHSAAVAGVQVEDAGLIAAYDPCDPGSGEGHGEADAARKVAAVGDRSDDRQVGGLVEIVGRDDHNRPMPTLFPALGRFQIDHVDVAALHSSSSPTAGASTHSRSSGGCGWE